MHYKRDEDGDIYVLLCYVFRRARAAAASVARPFVRGQKDVSDCDYGRERDVVVVVQYSREMFIVDKAKAMLWLRMLAV